jgi:RNA polymerase sigma-70 factor (ECF subfamily)
VEASTLEGAADRDADLDLAERHRRGDDRAFEEVYARYAGMIYSLALRLAGDPDTAADLTQEVFLRIYRHLGTFRGRSSLKTWVYQVGLNQCRSRLGRARPEAQPLPEEGTPAAAVALRDPGRGPESEALAADTGRRVGEALAALPLAFREAVVLRDIEGLAYEEIAALAGVPVGTVRSRIARGREQLRALLGGAR